MKKIIIILSFLTISTGYAFPGDDYNIGPFRCTHDDVLYAMTLTNCPLYTQTHHNHYVPPTTSSGTMSTAYDDNGVKLKNIDTTDLDCILKKIPDGD